MKAHQVGLGRGWLEVKITQKFSTRVVGFMRECLWLKLRIHTELKMELRLVKAA